MKPRRPHPQRSRRGRYDPPPRTPPPPPGRTGHGVDPRLRAEITAALRKAGIHHPELHAARLLSEGMPASEIAFRASMGDTRGLGLERPSKLTFAQAYDPTRVLSAYHANPLPHFYFVGYGPRALPEVVTIKDAPTARMARLLVEKHARESRRRHPLEKFIGPMSKADAEGLKKDLTRRMRSTRAGWIPRAGSGRWTQPWYRRILP